MKPSFRSEGDDEPRKPSTKNIDNLDDNCYSVLYYLNPEWKKKWGGQTIVDNEKIGTFGANISYSMYLFHIFFIPLTINCPCHDIF